MNQFEDNLWESVVNTHGDDLANLDRVPSQARGRLRRPRVLAGGSLGVAGVAAGLVIALGAGGASAPPALAVTTAHSGAVQVELNYVTDQNLPQLDQKLQSMGIHEAVDIQMAPGAATTAGPVKCTQASGADTPVQVLVGGNGTETIASGQSAGNTAQGSFHLVSCSAVPWNGTSTGTSGSAAGDQTPGSHAVVIARPKAQHADGQ